VSPQSRAVLETGKHAKHLPRNFLMVSAGPDCDTRGFNQGEGQRWRPFGVGFQAGTEERLVASVSHRLTHSRGPWSAGWEAPAHAGKTKPNGGMIAWSIRPGDSAVQSEGALHF
jgi:hypothetical protein